MIGKTLSAAAVLAFAGTAVAQKTDADLTSLVAVTTTYDGGTARAFSEGFEGLALGALNGQGGWTQFNALTGTDVSNVNPSTGLLHVRQTNAAASGVAAGAARATGPLGGVQSFEFDFSGSTGGGADYTFESVDSGLGVISSRLNMHWIDTGFGSALPDVRFLDSTGTLVAIGEWTPGTYATYRVDVDPVGGMDVYINGSLVFSDPNNLSGLGGAASADEVAFYNDSFQLAGETGDWDNVSATPTPGALGVLGLAGAAALRRRRN